MTDASAPSSSGTKKHVGEMTGEPCNRSLPWLHYNMLTYFISILLHDYSAERLNSCCVDTL